MTTASNGHAPDRIYFPGCVSRILGPLPNEDASPSVAETFVEVARRAGLTLAVPPDAANHCCGMPYSSKGLREAHAPSRAVKQLDLERFFELPDLIRHGGLADA